MAHRSQTSHRKERRVRDENPNCVTKASPSSKAPPKSTVEGASGCKCSESRCSPSFPSPPHGVKGAHRRHRGRGRPPARRAGVQGRGGRPVRARASSRAPALRGHSEDIIRAPGSLRFPRNLHHYAPNLRIYAFNLRILRNQFENLCNQFENLCNQCENLCNQFENLWD